MTTNTTTTLTIRPVDRALLAWRRHYQTVLYSLLVIDALVCVLLAWRSLAGPPSAHQAQPTPPLPVIIYATAQPVQPTALPPTATPDTRVLEELAALRQQVADLQAAQANQQQPAPQVVYQVVAAPAPAVATPEPEQYTVASTADQEAERRAAIQGHYVEPPAAELAPQTAAILDRGAWAQQAQAHNVP